MSFPARSGRERHLPFLELLGLRCDSAQDGRSTVTLALRPDLLNNHGAGHGGAVMTLLDSAMSHAALGRVDYTREVVTVEMKVNFMRPAHGRLTAHGQVTGGGRSLCFCEARVVGEDGELLAQAIGTFRYRDVSPAA